MKNTPLKSMLLMAALVAASAIANAAESTSPAAGANPSAKPLDLFANDIVARGDGVKVSRTMLDEALINIKSSAAARGQSIPPPQMKMLEAQVLGRLIGMQLLNKMATDTDKTTGAEAATKQFDLIKKNAGGDENFNRQLKTVGMTVEDLKKKLTDEATAEAVLQREIKFEVSDEDAKKFHEENASQFEQPELVRAAHILVGTRNPDGSEMADEKKKEQRKLADDLLKRAKANEDFAKLAKEYSEDPGSKDKGGEYTFPRGQMMPEFEAAAFSLETNQVSDVVTTSYGYHIIKLYEKKPAKKIELAEAVSDIKQYLKRQGMQKQIPSYMSKIEKTAHVEILDEELKKLIEEQEKASASEAAPADAPKSVQENK